jgi:hypothetical protein
MIKSRVIARVNFKNSSMTESHPLNIDFNKQGTYADAIKNMLDRKAKRLVVSLDDLRAHSAELCKGYLPTHGVHL